eukprot:9322446-Alexandrium_andersonii.AAC.1
MDAWMAADICHRWLASWTNKIAPVAKSTGAAALPISAFKVVLMHSLHEAIRCEHNALDLHNVYQCSNGASR